MNKVVSILTGIIGLLIPQFKKADSVVGVAETKEALIAMNEITIEVAKQFKDGVQFADFTAFYAEFTNNAAFKAKLEAGWDNYKAIPAEIKDMDIGEGLEIAAVQLEYVPAIVESLKK